MNVLIVFYEFFNWLSIFSVFFYYLKTKIEFRLINKY